MNHENVLTKTRVATITSLIAGIAFVTSAQAAVISGSSSGFALGVDLGLANDLVTADIKIPSAVGGNAPASYDINDSLLGADAVLNGEVTVDNLLNISLANVANDTLLASAASSNVDGGVGNRQSDASAEVNSLGLDIFSTQLLNTVDLGSALSISSSTIFADSSVSGDVNNLNATGSSYVEDLSISLFGLAAINHVNLGLQADALGRVFAPTNFNVLSVQGIAGLDLFLNEQVETCNNFSCSITVNALRLSFNGVDVSDLGGGLLNGNTLNGDVIIGQAVAALQAQADAVNDVPAPASAALMLLGILAAGTARKYRK